MSLRLAQRWQRPSGTRYPKPKAVQFVSAEEFLKLALQAHLAAVRASLPPPGERWIEPELDLTWSGPEDFHDGLLQQLGERLRLRALARGDLVDEPWDDAPVAVGHGDASPAPGACERLAHSDCQGGDRSSAALPADPLLLCPHGQGLPLPVEGPNVNGANGPEVHHVG